MSYDYNIAVDLEFTPTTKANWPRSLKAVIIEIGAVKLGLDGEEVDVFSKLVRPSLPL